MSLQEKMSEFVSSVEYRDLPADALKVAKQSLLDYFGVTLAGSVEPIGGIIKSYLEEVGCVGPSTVIGLGLKTPCPDAAFANGVLGHALDFDDSNPSLLGHPSVPVAPAVLAIGELLEASGKELLLAYSVGVEVECKLGLAVNPTHMARGWHCTSTLGTFGATAAAGKLLGLNSEQMMYAFGIAASQSAGVRANFGTMTKPFHAGRAAENGVVAAMLAKKGFTSNKNALEEEVGYLKVTTGEYNREAMEKLGNPWEMVAPGIYYKLYPCCHYGHAAINALLSIIRDNKIDPESVEGIEVGATQAIYDNLIYHEPKTGLEGKFSMQFFMADALLGRGIRLEDFTDERVRDPKIVEFMKKTKFQVDPEINKLVPYGLGAAISRVKIKTKRGEEFVKDGMPTAGLEELKQKYEICAGYVLTQDKIRESVRLVLELEKLDNLHTLMQLMH
ncbi:MAG: MmgE/PrpD family protein [Candidatus Jordarchaeaceae archaeon]